MLKAKFRFKPGHRDENPTPPWRLRALFLNLTQACDLRCDYCYAVASGRPASMSALLLERILDQAAAAGRPTIYLTGGEPLLYPHLELGLALARDRELAVKIATNGTHLDERTVELLGQYGVRSLQVSLDTMDPARYARVKGTNLRTHGLVLEGLRRLIEAKAFRVVISSVVKEMAPSEVRRLLSYGRESGIDSLTVYHLIPFGLGGSYREEAFDEAAFLRVLDEAFSSFSESPGFKAAELSVPWTKETPLLDRWSERLDIRTIGCVAGKHHLTILSDGTAVPCVCLPDPALSCGHIGSAALSEIWANPLLEFYRGERPGEECRVCDFLSSCRTGCRSLAYLSSGRPDGPDPSCRAWRPR